MKLINAHTVENNNKAWKHRLIGEIDGVVTVAECVHCKSEVIAEELDEYKFCPHCGKATHAEECGQWLAATDNEKKRCSKCGSICFIAIYPWFGGQAKCCPACGVKMERNFEAKILEDEIWKEFDSGSELLKSVK